MRTDLSYFVKESECYPAYKHRDDKVKILRVFSDDIEEKIIEGASDNESYDEKGECIIRHHIPGLFEDNVLSPVHPTDHFLKLCTYLPSYKDTFISLIFKDTLRRSELLFLINTFINYKSAKGILLLPESLAICVNLAIQNAIVIHYKEERTYISIIEDFVLTEVKRMMPNKESNILLFKQEEEFVDEFDTWEDYKLDKMFICDLCNSFFTREGILLHVINLHIRGGKCECRKGKNTKSAEVEKNIEDERGSRLNKSADDFSFLGTETVKNTEINKSIKIHAKEHIRSIFYGNTPTEKILNFLKVYITKERRKKLNTIISDKTTIERLQPKFNFNYVDIKTADSWAGVIDLLDIEIADELWMTDKEWNATRLRVLKEKLLFYL